MKNCFSLSEFEQGKTYEIYVNETVNGQAGGSLLYVVQRIGDLLYDLYVDNIYSIEQLNQSIVDGELWGKREYSAYKANRYYLVMSCQE